MTADPHTTADLHTTAPNIAPDPHTTAAPPHRPQVILIAMAGANRVIGDGADQPWHLREDQQRFARLTRGHPMVMGRATYDTFTTPLPGRPHVVVTRDRDWSAPGRPDVHVAHDPHEALELAATLPGGAERVSVIGGGQIYAALLDAADVVELTEVDADAPGDVLFPKLPESQWREARRDDRWAYAYVTYERR